MEAVEVVEHRHVERRRRRAFLLVAAHVQVVVAVAAIGEAMDQPRIAVKREQDRLVRGEDGVELLVGEPVRMLARRLQRHQVDDVDDADLQRRQPLAQQTHGRQRFERRHVAGARHHDVGRAVLVVARPRPDADAGSCSA